MSTSSFIHSCTFHDCPMANMLSCCSMTGTAHTYSITKIKKKMIKYTIITYNFSVIFSSNICKYIFCKKLNPKYFQVHKNMNMDYLNTYTLLPDMDIASESVLPLLIDCNSESCLDVVQYAEYDKCGCE